MIVNTFWTAAQFEAWQETGTDAACALVLGGRRDN